MVERVAVIGIGVIGGSLALAWKERLPKLHVKGYDRPDVLAQAQERGLIHESASSPADAVRDADAVFLAIPIGVLEPMMSAIAPHLSPHTLVTDVGSVKHPIIQAAEKILPDGIHFIGGHPMTGSERSGLDGANALLFENAFYILCPNGEEDSEYYTALTYLVKNTGAQVLRMDGIQHDRVVACVSHLPQLLATTLVNVTAEQNHLNPITLKLAAGGFRDMTRIATSPFEMWSAVLQSNAVDIELSLGAMVDALNDIRRQLRTEDTMEGLRPLFEKARAVREKIPQNFKGFLRPLSDVYVYAKDEPGVLAHISGTLFQKDISIKDIELLKIREGTGGAFRLSFENESAADAAVVALNSHGCRAHRLHR